MCLYIDQSYNASERAVVRIRRQLVSDMLVE
jgi:hypothetical protein